MKRSGYENCVEWYGKLQQSMCEQEHIRNTILTRRDAIFVGSLGTHTTATLSHRILRTEQNPAAALHTINKQ